LFEVAIGLTRRNGEVLGQLLDRIGKSIGMPSRLPPHKPDQSRVPSLPRVVLHAFHLMDFSTPRSDGIPAFVRGLLPGAPALTRTTLSLVRRTRLSGRAMQSVYAAGRGMPKGQTSTPAPISRYCNSCRRW
jgi:hypothetical protein